MILGVDLSPLVDVDADNSIFNRLERLLAYLETIAPDEGWQAYRDAGGTVRWDLVVASGHSRGAGHAAFVGRLERVARVVLFSGTEPAPWTQADDFETPAEDFYGFAHLLEPSYAPIQASWDNLGIPGAPTSVDGALPPFDGSHQLYTANEDCTGDPESNGFFHNCHCVDDWMPPPLADGTPYFQYTWDHLLRVDSAQPVPAFGSGGATLLALILLAAGVTPSIRRRGVPRPPRVGTLGGGGLSGRRGTSPARTAGSGWRQSRACSQRS